MPPQPAAVRKAALWAQGMLATLLALLVALRHLGHPLLDVLALRAPRLLEGFWILLCARTQ